MESKKFKWNKILNYIIAGTGLVLACLFIGLCFITPKASIKAKALSLNDIKSSSYNVAFTAAKTRIRRSKSYNKTSKTDKENSKSYSFDGYEYQYDDPTMDDDKVTINNPYKLYYTVNSENINDVYNSVDDSSDISLALKDSKGTSEFTVYTKYEQKFSPSFIPAGSEYFVNSDGKLEEIFYDYAENNDFVVLNNFSTPKSVTGSNHYNVENFYLSFGTPYYNEATKQTTPLVSLSVQAYLYTLDGRIHDLNLNKPDLMYLDEAQTKQNEYWHQYFDLTQLKGKISPDSSSSSEETYDIKNLEGKYVFTFKFIKYNKDLTPSTEVPETFNYSFYLLDGNNYDNYPTISNAQIGLMQQNKVSEYFYNFNQAETPYIEYDPTRYNITYTRENKEITETITSNFEMLSYQKNDTPVRNLPKGLISYYSNNNLKKEVYIITYYKNSQNTIEYLYLANNSSTSYRNQTTTWEDIEKLIDKNKLVFEYKLTRKLVVDGNTYTTTTYKSTDFKHCTIDSATPQGTIVSSDTQVIINDGTKYYLNSVSSDNLIFDTSNNAVGKSTTTPLLNQLLNISKVPLKYSYIINFNDLGVYNFNYKYVVPVVQNPIVKQQVDYVINDKTSLNNGRFSSLSDNITLPTDPAYDCTVTRSAKETEANFNLELTLSNVFAIDTDNNPKTKINGTTYTLKNNKKINNGVNDIILDETNFILFGTAKFDAVYSVMTRNNKQYLVIKVDLGSHKKTDTINSEIFAKSNIDYITNNYISTSDDLGTNDLKANDITDPNCINIYNLFKDIEDMLPILRTTKEVPTLATDKLHIFGTIAYFDKVDNTTDSGYSKLEYNDIKANKQYLSNITPLLTSSDVPTEGGFTQLIDGFTETLTDQNDPKRKITYSNLVVTDYMAVLWKNLSTMYYTTSHTPLSESFIYRYEYYVDDNGNFIVDYSSAKKLRYNKDVPIQGDGYYEVILRYTYDYYKTYDYDNHDHKLEPTKTFFQVYAFIIDQSSPNFTLEVVDELTTSPMPTNRITNKNIKISWETPSPYFKNDVYITIDRKDFSNNEEFSVECKKNTVSASDSDYDTYVNKIIDTNGSSLNKYVVNIVNPGKASNYTINGRYKVTIHFGIGNSTSELFTIDTSDITGMQILPVETSNDTIANGQMNYSSQIISSPFTFRYNAKASGAKISTKYYQIMFNSNSDAIEMLKNISNTNDIAVTTNFKIAGTNSQIDLDSQYIFEPTTSKEVAKSNIFPRENTTSCLYLFELVDEAGNSCRYVVLYDTTSPKFLTLPEPSNTSTNIVNDTTRIVWGNYKAIAIDTPAAFELINNVDEYSKHTDASVLTRALSYIATDSSTFDKAKIEKISSTYYLLLPLNQIEIKDVDNNINISTYPGFALNTTPTESHPVISPNINEFYFFPTNPVKVIDGQEKIEIPVYNETTGKPIYEDGAIKKHNYLLASKPNIIKAMNSSNKNVERLIVATYYLDDSKTTTKTIKGTIGQGKFTYTIYDIQRNYSNKVIWMNLDKTQTLAYGLFNYSGNINNKIALTGSTGTYSAAQVFISSLQESGSKGQLNYVPQYEVTYKFHAYNTELYNREVDKLEIVTDTKDSDITYLQISFKDGTSQKLQLTNEVGENYPRHSYPYNIQGNAIIANANGDPIDIYENNKLSYVDPKDPTRIFSRALNLETDREVGKTVTKEGLYIVKRKYSDTVSDIDIGLDSRIIYLVYYVDRTGIISIAANSSTAGYLYNLESDIGKDIGFTLGYGTKYTKDIKADTIYNNQKQPIVNSNKNYNYTNMFNTNKIDVEFKLTADKYGYDTFTTLNKAKYINLANSNQSIINALNDTLFNTRFDTQYKLYLTLSLGALNNNNNQMIIDENNIDSTKQFNSHNISNYINTDRQAATINGKRSNVYYMNVGDNNREYVISIKDNAGYDYLDSKGNIITNYACNTLSMTFKINHHSPDGDAYGKYYENNTNYDESTFDDPTSLPIIKDENGDDIYNILTEYLYNPSTGGSKLKPLSNTTKQTENTPNGTNITLFNTNNETLIFVFAITNNDTEARIDTGNIKIHKGNQLIFNRENGEQKETSLVSSARQLKSFTCNNIDGIDYYAIIVFDNNLDDILNESEKGNYSNYRLLDSNNNSDFETYYLTLQYVGDSKTDYTNGDSGNTFGKTTYKIVVDRIKPMYNLTKLMSLDKYIYNPEKTAISNNYEKQFATYSKYYNITHDSIFDMDRSDILENYFFAIDARNNSSFVFENVSDLDNDNGMYFRKISPDNYKFSVTPDDYKAYKSGEYLEGHTKFISSNATIVNSTSFNRDGKYNGSIIENTYYRLSYDLSDTKNQLSASWLVEKGFFQLGSYYEIIESDEAGNYRVYAIYVHDVSKTSLTFSYNYNNDDQSIHTIKMSPTAYPTQTISGMKFAISEDFYETSDMYLQAHINVNSSNLKSDIIVSYNPMTNKIYLKDSKNKIQHEFSVLYDSKKEFVSTINELIDSYNRQISDPSSQYYTDYGYVITISLMDRLGIAVANSNELLDYKIIYNVAGSVLKAEKIYSDSTSFSVKIPGKKGSTIITNVTVYKFNTDWRPIDSDSTGNPFYKTASQFEKDNIFVLTKGVYRFTLTDNFNRKIDYYFEFGVSSTQPGGSLIFADPNSQIKHSNGYTYTSNEVKYTYDSSVYNIHIRFFGTTINETDGITEDPYDESTPEGIFYVSGNSYSDAYLQKFGIIKPITTSNNITTITFSGVNNLSKYHIKTIMASTAANSGYEWNQEQYDKNLLVYNNKVAIYNLIPNVTIKNLNGVTLNTDTHLNLTEDFELSLAWPTNKLADADRIDFNSRIKLIRVVNNNGHITTTTSIVNNGYIVKEPGEYTAYVINDLNNSSPSITFTRGIGQISMYAIYRVDSSNYINEKLESSSYTQKVDNKMIFTYFTTTRYFNLLNDTNILTLEELSTDITNQDQLSKIKFNTNKPYIDVRVNSNLNILTELNKIGIENDIPFVQYEIYSTDSVGDRYTYRFIKIYFIDQTNTMLTKATITTANINSDSNLATIKSTDNKITVKFEFESNSTLLIPIGDNIKIHRYYNGSLIETKSLDILDGDNLPVVTFTLTTVGLHQFSIEDLAGRTHLFSDNSVKSDLLSIYQINEILFTVNDVKPINNQIFNGQVKINVQTKLADLTLYDSKTIGYLIYRDTEEIQMPTTGGELIFTTPGRYTIKMNATSSIDGQEITATYNFTILDPLVANRSFNISKGSGFSVVEIWKIVNGERSRLTPDKYVTKDSKSLIDLTHADHGNSTFEITLSYFDDNTSQNRSFTFNIWINEDQPIILSNVPKGSITKETINLNYNPGIIYQQIGKCYIKVYKGSDPNNIQTIIPIDKNSNSIVETISISKSGEYWVQIVLEDGTIVSSDKFTKSEPLNNTTKIILICAGIAVVVVVVLFFLIRKKGKYR